MKNPTATRRTTAGHKKTTGQNAKMKTPEVFDFFQENGKRFFALFIDYAKHKAFRLSSVAGLPVCLKVTTWHYKTSRYNKII